MGNYIVVPLDIRLNFLCGCKVEFLDVILCQIGWGTKEW